MLASCSLKAFGGKGPEPKEIIPAAWAEPGRKAEEPPVPWDMMTPTERKAWRRTASERADAKRLVEREEERAQRRPRRRK